MIIDYENNFPVMPVLLAGITVAIMILSLVPEDAINLPISEVLWNIAHIPAYTVFTVMAILVISKYYGTSYKAILMTGLATSLYGLIIELIQPYVGRQMSLNDIIFNELGISLAVVLALIFSKRVKAV